MILVWWRMNKRRNQRIEVIDLVANVSDGTRFFSGNVCDISRHGVQVNSISDNLEEQAKALSITISISGVMNFKKMRGMLRWVSGNAPRKKMGIHFIDTFPSWTVFVKNFEAKETETREA